MTDDRWLAAADLPGHPLAALDAAEVGQGVRLVVEVGPRVRGSIASRWFRAYLDEATLGRTLEPVLTGIHHDHSVTSLAGVEVTDFRGNVPVAGGDVDVPEGIDLQIVEALAKLVPPGGALMMEYESAHRRSTARALAQRVPAAATPLGGLMFAAGCGMAFQDRHTAGGGRSGRRALAGYRAVSVEHEMARGPAMLTELDHFLGHSADLDWDLQLKCRPLAEAAITVLRVRLGAMPSAFQSPNGKESTPLLEVRRAGE